MDESRPRPRVDVSFDLESTPIRLCLYESAYARLGLIFGTNVMLFQQGVESIPQSEFEATWNKIFLSLAAVDRASHVLMLDVRRARGRNDPEFERMFAPQRARFVSGWRKVAVVVMTAPGILQVQRYAREDSLDLRIFDDPNAAFRWLRDSN